MKRPAPRRWPALKEINPDYEVMTKAIDLCDYKAVQELYKEIIAKWGRLDVLVNNAGTDNSTWLTKLKQSEWDAVCNLNMKGPYTMMKYAIPHLIKTKGCIVNTASVAGVYGCPTGLPYPASKAALIAMTKSVAYSFADRGVRVNAVAPGVVNTDMVANMPRSPRTPSVIPSDEALCRARGHCQRHSVPVLQRRILRHRRLPADRRRLPSEQPAEVIFQSR